MTGALVRALPVLLLLLCSSVATCAGDVRIEMNWEHPAVSVYDMHGVPAMERSGGGHGPAPKPIPLPLEVTIIDIWPRVAASNDRVMVEVRARNTGKNVLVIPISTSGVVNGKDLFQPGNLDRRILRVYIELTFQGLSPDIKKEISGVAQTAGSVSVPESMAALAPGESVWFRTEGAALGFPLPHKFHEQRSVVTATVSAYVNEEFIEDSEYVSKRAQESARSRNVIEGFTLSKPIY